jgi:hypothetical protein
LGLTATNDKYARAFLRETLGDAEADPGAAAGDDSDFACELACHHELSFGLHRASGGIHRRAFRRWLFA